MVTDREKGRFLQRISAAVDIAKQKGAVLNALAVIAQAAHESAWGTSLLAREANNLFGVKATPSQIQAGQVIALPTREWTGSRWIRETDYWALYPSWNECLGAYSKIIQSLSWFKDAIPHADPPQGDGNALEWLKGLEEPGRPDWATDPNYVAEVGAVGETVGAMLGRSWPV